jgi:crotonobetainyl-CoA:carnitine CoA-transferase CaiB-like acyl-CoA transferase
MRTAAPAAGEHTDQVLKELGLGAGEIAAMREKKIIA